MGKNIFSRFNFYQKERFPLAVLFFTTASIALSSSAVIPRQINLIHLTEVFVAVMVYLFHIRVIDEQRDYHHDNQHHKFRPIQKGVISIKELESIDLLGILIFLAIATAGGSSALIIALVVLFYSFIAAKDFFGGEKLREAFFLYNALSMVQLLFLQLFVYTLLAGKFYFSQAVLVHLAFVLASSILIEIVRKIKIGPEESTGRDTYSWRISFGGSLLAYSLFAVFNYAVFLGLVYSFNTSCLVFSTSLALVLSLLAAAFFHYLKRDKKSEKVLLFFNIVFYVGLNLIIYFSSNIRLGGII